MNKARSFITAAVVTGTTVLSPVAKANEGVPVDISGALQSTNISTNHILDHDSVSMDLSGFKLDVDGNLLDQSGNVSYVNPTISELNSKISTLQQKKGGETSMNIKISSDGLSMYQNNLLYFSLHSGMGLTLTEEQKYIDQGIITVYDLQKNVTTFVQQERIVSSSLTNQCSKTFNEVNPSQHGAKDFSFDSLVTSGSDGKALVYKNKDGHTYQMNISNLEVNNHQCDINSNS